MRTINILDLKPIEDTYTVLVVGSTAKRLATEISLSDDCDAVRITFADTVQGRLDGTTATSTSEPLSGTSMYNRGEADFMSLYAAANTTAWITQYKADK